MKQNILFKVSSPVKIIVVKALMNYRILTMCMLLSLVLCCSKQEGDNTDAAFNKLTYEQSTQIFPNPERGFIHHLEAVSEGEGLDLIHLKSLRNENVSMILRMYYLEKFKNLPLSVAQLTLFNDDMAKLREAGIKCVLRFAYTADMAGTDASLTIVEQHLDQLKPFFEANKDVIAFVQAGFIGAWGEWHNSSNGLATIENERIVLYKLLSVLPTEILVQVRTPGVKQQIFNTTLPIESTIAYTDDKRSRVGHHNDCFLAGGTDYGTYINITADKDYISKEALYVPTGGETCPPEDVYPDCSTGQTEMKLLKWTFLNLDWYQPVINVWKNSWCYDEFQRNLGYRLCLMNTKLPKEVALNKPFNVEITLTNKGYAPLYNFKITNLVLKDKTSGNIYSIELLADIRKCKPNGLFTIDENVDITGIPQGEYDLYLNITDRAENLKDRVEYKVRLANTNIWEETLGMNNLLLQLKINAK
jgi:hypothetical protein